MDAILYILGLVGVAIGGVTGYQTFQILQATGVGYTNVLFYTTLAVPIAFFVVGVLIVALGSVITLLRQIRNSSAAQASYFARAAHARE